VNGDRMRRVNEALREVLSARIAEGLKDPRIGFVTVTAVETSPDLRHARVYVSVLGNEQERQDSLAGLQHAHGLLQAEIAKLTHMKRTPELKFVYDETVEKGMRINELLSDEETGLRPPRSGSAVEGEARSE
jgi:ribosome-binding factor A